MIYLLWTAERAWARNSAAVVKMESHFLVLELKRPDWTAPNYCRLIDSRGRRAAGNICTRVCVAWEAPTFKDDALNTLTAEIHHQSFNVNPQES